jgi:hypothetical protein
MTQKTDRFNISTEFLLGMVLLAFIVSPEQAWAQTSFFQGKTVTIIQGRDPGGTGDMRVKAMLSFLQKYIPGIRPSITSTCLAVEAARRQITFTNQPALTGLRSETSVSA